MSHAGRGKVRVRKRGSDGRNTGFADSGRRRIARHDVHRDLARCFVHSQQITFVEARLLRDAVLERDFLFQCGSEPSAYQAAKGQADRKK